MFQGETAPPLLSQTIQILDIYCDHFTLIFYYLLVSMVNLIFKVSAPLWVTRLSSEKLCTHICKCMYVCYQLPYRNATEDKVVTTFSKSIMLK